MSWNPTKGVLSPHGGLLDRVASKPQSEAPTETQAGVDQLVGSAAQIVSDEKMMASLFTAGVAGKFIRLGSLARSASSLESLALRAVSHVTALAGESAVFAGMERNLADHAPTHAFQKDWARAFINLGSLKLLGGAAAGQNLVVQHLFTDLGMVAGHEAGFALGVTEAPQGSLAQRMIQAEGMNLGMKGSLALLHGFAPGLSAMERSLDLALGSRDAKHFTQNQSAPFFSRLAMVAVGGPEGAKPGKTEDLSDFSLVYAKRGSEGGSSGNSLLNPETAPEAPKSLEKANSFHNHSKALIIRAEALNKKDPFRLDCLKSAFENEWAAAHLLPPRNEMLRAKRYVKAVQLALEAEDPGIVKTIIIDALRNDFGALAEDAIRGSAKKLRLWNKNRRFILKTLEEAKAHLDLLATLNTEFAKAGAGPHALKSNLGIFMMSSGSESPKVDDRDSVFQAKIKSLAETSADKMSDYERLKMIERDLSGRKSIYLIVAIIKMAKEKVLTGEISKVTPEGFAEELYRKYPDAEKDLPPEDFLKWFHLSFPQQ